ncbi:MAG TPA: lanthionine synthetase LanC family protein [Pseudonocardia sp.]|uniref:lanthionine synthetase LanC family protein n=1 Tax=Pseudonocardia sp. TaxID=60912 RepID=UPI002F42234B
MGGHANLGIAHGIAGPLALLATAARHDITVPGHHDAIGRICDWLEHWRRGTPDRAWWPEMLSLPEAHTGILRQPGPGRPSWCYGTPGLARAQQLAALALGDPHRQHRAEQALIGCLDDDHQLGQITDASLCHGWAGLVHTTYRAAADSRTGELADRLPRLHPGVTQQTSRHRLNGDGLLEGDAGLHLVNDTITHAPPPSGWDGCLLLTGSPPTARTHRTWGRAL